MTATATSAALAQLPAHGQFSVARAGLRWLQSRHAWFRKTTPGFETVSLPTLDESTREQQPECFDSSEKGDGDQLDSRSAAPIAATRAPGEGSNPHVRAQPLCGARPKRRGRSAQSTDDCAMEIRKLEWLPQRFVLRQRIVIGQLMLGKTSHEYDRLRRA